MQRREPYATCSSVSVCGNRRRILPTVLHSTSNCQDLSSAGFLIFFSSMRTMECKKSFRKGDWQIGDSSPFSSNCLVIGEWFPLSHYLACRRRGRQMWLSGNWLSPGRMCWGTGRSFAAQKPVICFTPVLIFPHDQ